MKELFKQILKENGFSDLLILALEGVIEKESGWTPKRETPYTNTSNDRIREVFPTLFGSKSDAFINVVKEDPKTFFDYVYGNKFGNNHTEGYKYRGGGLNMVTFKDGYQQAKDSTGIDVISNPDLINVPENAAKIAAHYFIDAFNGKNKAPKGIENAAVQATLSNAGWPKKINTVVKNDTQKVLNYMKDNLGEKKNSLGIFLLLVTFCISIVLILLKQ